MDITLNTKRFQNTIFLIIFLVFLSREEIINNPVKINDFSNPMVIKRNSNYHIFTSGQYIILDNDNRLIESSSNFIEYNAPYALCYDESYKNSIYIKNSEIYFNLTYLPNYVQKSLPSISYPSSTNYVGYITETQFEGELILCARRRCKIDKNEIVIYGKNTFSITFSFILKEYSGDILISSSVEDQFSCKVIINSVYICALINNKVVNLYIIGYLTNLVNCDISKIDSKEVNKMKTHTAVTLYDTNDNTIKILCAKNTKSNTIECIFVSCEIKEKCIVAVMDYTAEYIFGDDFFFIFSFRVYK
mgnify:CR=1 FL=1